MQTPFITSFALVLGVSALTAQQVTVISRPNQGPAVAHGPYETYQGIAIAGVSVALQSDTDPCFTGVPTCTPDISGGLSLGFPRYYLQSRQENFVTVVVEDTDYTGPGIVKVVPRLILGGGVISDVVNCQPNTDYIFVIPLTLPFLPGSPLTPITLHTGLILSDTYNTDEPYTSGATQNLALGLRDDPPPATFISPASISIGAQTAGLPCSGCGPAALTPGISIPVPRYVVTRD